MRLKIGHTRRAAWVNLADTFGIGTLAKSDDGKGIRVGGWKQDNHGNRVELEFSELESRNLYKMLRGHFEGSRS